MNQVLLILLFSFLTIHSYANMQIELVGTAKTPNCSGVIFAHPHYQKKHKALFLTNSHCLNSGKKNQRYMSPEEILWDSEFTEKIKVLTAQKGIFYGNLLKSLWTEKILFASIEHRDIAVIQLKYTYAKIEKEHNIKPYILHASRDLKAQDSLQILGSYHEQIYDCQFKYFAKNFVAAGPYLWHDVLVLNRCLINTKPGDSGSAVIIKDTKKLIGLHNSAHHDNGSPCDTSNACEYDHKGRNISTLNDAYSQNLDFLFSCFDSDFAIKTELCELAF